MIVVNYVALIIVFISVIAGLIYLVNRLILKRFNYYDKVRKAFDLLFIIVREMDNQDYL